MTYYVSSGTLNPTHLLHLHTYYYKINPKERECELTFFWVTLLKLNRVYKPICVVVFMAK